MNPSSKITDRYRGWIKRLAQLEKLLAVTMLVVILVTMFLQVIARYVFNSPFSWSEELARLAMIWLTFLSASWVAANQGHIRVDLWGTSLSESTRFWMDGLVHLLIIACCLFLIVGGMRFVWYVHPVASPSLGIPKSLWYGAVSAGVTLMALHHLLHLLVIKER